MALGQTLGAIDCGSKALRQSIFNIVQERIQYLFLLASSWLGGDGQGALRHILQRGFHIIMPDFCGDGAACHFGHRGEIIGADPDACGDVGGVADKPSIAEIIG